MKKTEFKKRLREWANEHSQKYADAIIEASKEWNHLVKECNDFEIWVDKTKIVITLLDNGGYLAIKEIER